MPRITEGTIALGSLFAVAIWCLLGLPIYYGPPNLGEQQRVVGERAAQNTNVKPDGSIAAPFVVQVIPGLKSAEERSQEAEDREEKKSADRWLVRWTFALFAATIGLILATGVLGYFAYRQSRDMKASIEIARKAAAHEFRAYLYVKIVAGTVAIDKRIEFEAQIINYGRSPAENVKFAQTVVVRGPGWTWDEGGELPVRGAPCDVTVHPVEPVSVMIDSEFVLPSAAYKSIELGTSVIYANGIAFYRDVFGVDHETRIAFEFSGPVCFRTKKHRMSATGNYAK